jgi:hypothetical protein
MKGNPHFARDFAATSIRRRFDRVARGFLVGGLTAAAACCALGAGMPYGRRA